MFNRSRARAAAVEGAGARISDGLRAAAGARAPGGEERATNCHHDAREGRAHGHFFDVSFLGDRSIDQTNRQHNFPAEWLIALTDNIAINRSATFLAS